jgi:hypothetical protein
VAAVARRRSARNLRRAQTIALVGLGIGTACSLLAGQRLPALLVGVVGVIMVMVAMA